MQLKFVLLKIEFTLVGFCLFKLKNFQLTCGCFIDQENFIDFPVNKHNNQFKRALPVVIAMI